MTDHLVVVKNDASSNNERLRRQIVDVNDQALVSKIDVLDVDFDAERMADKLRKAVEAGSAVVTAMGDGGNSYIGGLCVSAAGRERGLDNVPLLLGRGGNANDIASMMNGRKNLATVLRYGWAERYRPLEIDVNDDDPRFALGYFSVGGSAAASHRLEAIKNGPLKDYPWLRFAQEAVSSGLTTARYPTFTVRSAGVETQATDVMALRGDRIAKIAHPHARLQEPLFEFVSLRSEGVVHTTRKMFQMQRGALWGIMREQFSMTVQRENGQPVMAQADGEAFEIISGSTVDIAISEHSYTVLTTRR